MKKAAIYTRVSTQDQHPEMQHKEFGRVRKTTGLEALQGIQRQGNLGQQGTAPDALLEDCRRKKPEVVVVRKFDRTAGRF